MDGALKALADPRRSRIVKLVWSNELAASEIAAHFPDVTRPAVSQHLSLLKDSGLLLERRDGTRRLYRANHAEFVELRSFIDSFWTTSLERLRDLAENDQTTKEQQ